jgi:hypothetical protein
VTILRAIAAFLAEIWRGIWGRITDEPVLTLGLINGGILLAVGFGLPITKEQVALTGAFVAAFLAWVARRQVTPT